MIRAAARAGLEARSTAFARATTKPELDQTRLECIALQAALSSLFQESREELVAAIAPSFRQSTETGDRSYASAALDALAHHLLGEQKPDE